MIGKNGLLSILQFVAVIIPAFVVLIEVVISRDMTEGIEIQSFKLDEIRLLEYSLLFLIFGTGLILYRLLSFIQNPFTTYGVLFIFGSIPLSAVALWIMSNRREYDGSENDNISDFIQKNMVSSFHKAALLFVSALAPIAAIWFLADIVNNSLNFGIFFGNSILSPHQFVSIGFIIGAVKSMSDTIDDYESSEAGFSGLLGSALGSGIVIVLIYILFVSIPYAVAIAILRFGSSYSFVEPTNVLLNLPFIWAIVVYYALLSFDYSSSTDDNENTPASSDQ